MPNVFPEIVVKSGDPNAEVAGLNQRVAALENALRQLLAAVDITGGRLTLQSAVEVRIIAPLLRIGTRASDMVLEARTLTIDANDLACDALNVTVAAGEQVQISALQQINVVSVGRADISGAQITLSAPLVDTPGVFRTQTMIATSVVGSSYTPGVGNIW